MVPPGLSVFVATKLKTGRLAVILPHYAGPRVRGTGTRAAGLAAPHERSLGGRLAFGFFQHGVGVLIGLFGDKVGR